MGDLPVATASGLLELRTGDMASGGGCVARAPDGRVVFVRHALPGERVLARITAETRSYLRADAVTVLERSPDRVTPPCPFAGPGRCGGCDWQHIALDAQRRFKAGLISEQLRRVAGVDPPVQVMALPGQGQRPDDGLGWRSRVRFSVDRDGRAGLRRHRSHQVEAVDHCLIVTPGVEAVGAERHRWPGVESVEVMASADGAQRVVSVTRARAGRGMAGRRARGGGATGGARAADGLDPATGLVVDRRTRRRPDGLDTVVAGRRFHVSAGVFWQVHPAAAETLARVVLEDLEPKRGDHVLDLYAGAGLFAAVLGDAVGPSGSVLAVEGQKRACSDAARNTADQAHVTVLDAPVDAALATGRVGHPDLIVLDPARAGAGPAVTAAIAHLAPGPRRVVYVSCDPASFARDLRAMLDAGWTLGALRAFDLFPMTEHVELVGTLEAPGH